MNHKDKCELRKGCDQGVNRLRLEVSSHMRRPQEEIGSARSQSLLWAALIAKSLAFSRSFTQSFQIVVLSRVMPGASHDRCRAAHSSPSHGRLLMEHQRTRASWTVLSTPDEQFERIRAWSSDVLAAEVNEAERAAKTHV